MGRWLLLVTLALLVGCAVPSTPSGPVAGNPAGNVASVERVPQAVAPTSPVPTGAPAQMATTAGIPPGGVATDVGSEALSVIFPRGSAQLAAESGAVIRMAAEALKGERSRTVLLVGYSGHRGSREISLALAVRRISVVEKELLRQGVHRGQIRKVARGYLKSVLEQCRGSACDQRLQRVELRLVDKTGRELEQSS